MNRILVLALIVLTLPLCAGTVITANLPANTAIVNIDGTADGARNYSGNAQAFWYTPFNTNGTLLQYTITPGTYSFTVVNPTDAAIDFPALTSAQLSQIYSAWTYNSPSILDYMAFDVAAANNSSLYQLFDGAPDPNSYGDPTNAYYGGKTNGWLSVIRLGSQGGRATTNYTNSFTTTTNETMIFICPDYDLGDNHGGVSVIVRPVINLLLNITRGTNQVAVTWGTNSDGHTLQSTTNLLGTWVNVTNVPVISGTNYSVTLSLDAAQRFFKLLP